MKILLTNDDGVRADGLAILASRLQDLAEVWVVAPDRERSAISHAFTLHQPLRVDQVAPRWFATSGTPADCVYLGLLDLCKGPDLVLSGINHGYNLGSDIFYSGTVAGAVEAALRGVPALAVSMGAGPGADFAPAAELVHALVQAIAAEGLPAQTLLNVNVPGPRDRPGVFDGKPATLECHYTRLGKRLYRDSVEKRTDPRGGSYYWIGGSAAPLDDPPGTDVHAIRHGVASVTPLHLDLTHADLLANLPRWHVPGLAQGASSGERSAPGPSLSP